MLTFTKNQPDLLQKSGEYLLKLKTYNGKCKIYTGKDLPRISNDINYVKSIWDTSIRVKQTLEPGHVHDPKKGARKIMTVEDKGSLSCIYEQGLYKHTP
jgi:hypothetical protein